MKVEISQVSATEWNQNIVDFHVSVFATASWLESVKGPGLIPVFFNLHSENKMVAKMSGLVVGNKGKINYKLYFFAGPAPGKNQPASILTDCYDAMAQHCRENKYNRMYCLSYDYPYQLELADKFHLKKRSEYIIRLDLGMDEFKRQVNRQIRRLSRKASENGFTLEESRDPKLVDTLFDYMENTRAFRLNKGYPDYGLTHMLYGTREAMMRMLEKDAAEIHMAIKDQAIHGIRYLLLGHEKAYAYYMGIKQESYKLNVSQYLNYESMLLLREKGYKALNMGGIPAGEANQGIRDFKRHLGAVAAHTQNASTGFLRFPYNLLNPVVLTAKALPPNRLTRRFRNIW